MSAGIDSTAMQRGLGGGETGIPGRHAAGRTGGRGSGREGREGGLTPQRDDIRRRKGTGLGSRGLQREWRRRGARQARIEKAWCGKTDRQRKKGREKEKEKERGRKGAVYWGKLFLSLFRQAANPSLPDWQE